MNTPFLLKKISFLLFLGIVSGNHLLAQWTTLITDPTGDHSNSALLDGTQLEYRYDAAADSLWFRFTTAGINLGQSADFGINIMINDPSVSSKFNFWGDDNKNQFTSLVTAWVTGAPPSSYSGTIGIANAAGVNSAMFTNSRTGNLTLVVDRANQTILVGMKRTDLIPNGSMGKAIQVAAAVGASNSWNDDLYSSTASFTLPATSSVKKTENTTISIYPNPASDKLHFTGLDNYSSYRIYDLTGKVISNASLSGLSHISVGNLTVGTYMIEFVSKTATTTRKRFVKN